MSLNSSRTSIGHRFHEFVRFIGAGLMSNVVYFGSLGALLAVFQEPLWLHAGVAYLLSTVANYLLHYTITFRSSSQHGLAIRRYVPVQAVALALNSWILYFLVSHLGLHYIFGQAVAIVITTIWSYLANRNWVFASGGRGN
jgi:putative flippase GtrA